MEIIREKYIKQVASALEKNRLKILKLQEKDTSQMTERTMSNHYASLNWECMHREMNEERLRWALGDLKASDVREFYEPSSFHKYKGIKEEILKIKLV